MAVHLVLSVRVKRHWPSFKENVDLLESEIQIPESFYQKLRRLAPIGVSYTVVQIGKLCNRIKGCVPRVVKQHNWSQNIWHVDLDTANLSNECIGSLVRFSFSLDVEPRIGSLSSGRNGDKAADVIQPRNLHTCADLIRTNPSLEEESRNHMSNGRILKLLLRILHLNQNPLHFCHLHSPLIWATIRIHWRAVRSFTC